MSSRRSPGRKHIRRKQKRVRYIHIKGVKCIPFYDEDSRLIAYDLAPSEKLDSQLQYWESQARAKEGLHARYLLGDISKLRALVDDDEQRAEVAYHALWTGKQHLQVDLRRTAAFLPPEARRAIISWLDWQSGIRRRTQEYRAGQLALVEQRIVSQAHPLLEQGYSIRAAAKLLNEKWDLELDESSRYRDGRPSVEMIRKVIARRSPSFPNK